MAKTTGKEEEEKPAMPAQEVVKDDKNEISSCSSDDVGSPELKNPEKAKKSASDGLDELDCAADLNKLKEDMDWINLQIEKETPSKNTTTERKADGEKIGTEAQSSSEASTPAPDVSPNTLGEKASFKKSKGNFEFPEGGLECSKC